MDNRGAGVVAGLLLTVILTMLAALVIEAPLTGAMTDETEHTATSVDTSTGTAITIRAIPHPSIKIPRVPLSIISDKR
jgi:archaellum component FlaG (FlaF/FlaG flagellin family)